MYWGNIVAPAVSLAAGLIYAPVCIRRGKFQRYLAAAAVLSVINTLFAASVHMLHQRYYLAGDAGTLRLYLMYMLFDIVFMVCCIIYLASGLLFCWKAKCPEYQYKNTNFLDGHAVVRTDAGEYRLSEIPCYTESIGEMIYNSYTDVIYVFPDSACEKFLPVMCDRFIITQDTIPYRCARELENRFLQQYPEEPDKDTGVRYYLRMRTLQTNESKAGTFVLQIGMTYGAIVLMVICLTILSLQQLSEAAQYRYRFGVLHRLGVEQQEKERLILKQLAVWFGLPIAVAVCMSVCVITCFFRTIAVQITAYVGWQELLWQVAAMAGIFGALLVCYFIITYMLFKPVVRS